MDLDGLLPFMQSEIENMWITSLFIVLRPGFYAATFLFLWCGLGAASIGL